MRISRSVFSVAAGCALAVGMAQQTTAESPVRIDFVGRYVVPAFDEIDGVEICRKNGAESVAFDPQTERLFVTNRTNLVGELDQAITVPAVDALDISNPGQPALQFQIDISTRCDDGDPETEAEPTSVAVNRGRVAVAVKLVKDGGDDETARGCVAFFDAQGNFLNEVGVGSLPDMVTFTPDGDHVLTADEGEASQDYTSDPEGSVSIIDISHGVDNATVRTADFTRFNNRAKQLRKAGVRIFGPGASVAQDLEPEYIAVTDDSRTAYVTLEENNALAQVSIKTAKVTRLLPLGFKDHDAAGNELDASNEDDAINIRNWPVLGMYQPDAIASFRTRGRTYLVTVNEGDSRDKNGFSEVERIKDVALDGDVFPDAADLQLDENLGRLKVTTALGDPDGDGDFDELYAFGARSFSIWTNNGRLVFDSGAEFARVIESLIEDELLPEGAFNTADDKTEFDDRSDDSGMEPEGVTVGEIDGRWYAFSILERVGGIMAYDVSDPRKARLVQYVTSRNFDQDSEIDEVFPGGYSFPEGLDENDFSKCNPGSAGPGDSAPEVILFISAEDSPVDTPLLAIGHETTSTTAIYAIVADSDD